MAATPGLPSWLSCILLRVPGEVQPGREHDGAVALEAAGTVAPLLDRFRVVPLACERTFADAANLHGGLLYVVLLGFLASPEKVEPARAFHVIHQVEILDVDFLPEAVLKGIVVA